MTHHATPDFWRCYGGLPEAARRTADKNYRLLEEDPQQQSLHIKKIRDGLWSARVGIGYRALATDTEDGDLLWFWIGPHHEYDRLVR